MLTRDENIKPCERCQRIEKYCVCEFATALDIKTEVLVLQHPQEPGVDIGTAPIIAATFPKATIRTGLSWPNLKKALGREVDPRLWGVLYLGSVRTETLTKERTLFVVDKKGVPLAKQDPILSTLEGIVLIDGTWSQAKSLWWRNAWLLKLNRLVVRSDRRSLYDAIRKEPRKGCLSTVETLGEVLQVLEKKEDIYPAIERPLKELVERLKKTGRPAGRRLRERSGFQR
jgi:DTW domain-containing protein YfiP